MAIVIDTNVLIAANGRETHASARCRAAAGRLLLQATESEVLEDEGGAVWGEYFRYGRLSGQPGVGDQFLQWFHQNRYVPGRVRQVAIGIGEEITTLIPASLRSLDRADHKWVALYLVGKADAIYNCTDSDWTECEVELQAEGIKVIELCSDELRR